jgi:alpha-tubulin suppressor-like RCC1 family protein
VCWGTPSDSDPMLDAGQTQPPDGEFVSVACRDLSCCAINVFDQAYCWGQTIGLGASGDAVQVSVGGSETCIVEADHEVACVPVGEASYKEMGPYLQVVVGRTDFNCGLSEAGEISCWGTANDNGQADPPSGTFSRISAGLFHACGIRDDESVECWGNNDYGQTTPPPGTFVHLSAGDTHTCGVKSDGSVACWGAGTTGDDCQGTAFECGQASPLQGTYVQVSAGYTHTCGIKEDGSLACWGSNTADKSTPPADFRSW